MNLRRVLWRNAALAIAGSSVCVALAYSLWAIPKARTETAAVQQTVALALEAARRAQTEPPEQLERWLDAHALLTPPRHVDLRIDARPDTGRGAPAAFSVAATHADTTLGSLSGWFAKPADQVIALGPNADSPKLVISANVNSELVESLDSLALTLFALLALCSAIALTQTAALARAFAPVGEFVKRLHAFGSGRYSVRLPEPPLKEFALIARSFNKLADSLAETVTEQKRLNHVLRTTRERERQLMARELHDDFGQILTALSADVTVLRRQLGRAGQEDEAFETASSLEQQIRELQLSIRAMLERLRAGQQTSLRADPRVVIAHWQQRHPQVAWRVDKAALAGLHRLPDEQLMLVFRVIQESLTNAFRHAQPTQIAVLVAEVDHSAHLIIENDGILRRADAAQHAAAVESSGLGLRGMRERAELTGTTLTAGPLQRNPDRWRVELTLRASPPERKPIEHRETKRPQ